MKKKKTTKRRLMMILSVFYFCTICEFNECFTLKYVQSAYERKRMKFLFCDTIVYFVFSERRL